LCMECNLIALPTVIVALSALSALITLVAGGVGLGKPGSDLGGGEGSHQHTVSRMSCIVFFALL